MGVYTKCVDVYVEEGNKRGYLSNCFKAGYFVCTININLAATIRMHELLECTNGGEKHDHGSKQ